MKVLWCEMYFEIGVSEESLVSSKVVSKQSSFEKMCLSVSLKNAFFSQQVSLWKYAARYWVSYWSGHPWSPPSYPLIGLFSVSYPISNHVDIHVSFWVNDFGNLYRREKKH